MEHVRGLDPHRGGVSRRTLLAGGLGAIALGAGGCRAGSPDALAADTPSVRTLLKDRPFLIGARGGSADWPELTAYGFEQAAAIPAIKAMEVWVCRTSDGVLVCSADPTTKRVTGRDYTILKETWATLSTLKVTAAGTTDRNQPAQPLARLDELMDRYLDRFVFVVEPRVGEAISNLMAQLISVGHPERIVWKQPINANRFDEAKQHGFSTWGYVLDEPAHTGRNLKRLARSDAIDLLGISVTRSKQLVTSVVAAAAENQKQTIGFNVSDRDDFTSAIALGCTGIASRAIKQISTLRV